MNELKPRISLAALWNLMPPVVRAYFVLFLMLLGTTVVVWICDLQLCLPHAHPGEAGGTTEQAASAQEGHHLFPIFANAFTAAFGAVIGALSQWAGAQLNGGGRRRTETPGPAAV